MQREMCLPSWHRPSWNALFQGFLPTADPDLHYALRSYHDSSAIEAHHAERMLDVFVRLASDAEWRKWLRVAMQVAAVAGNLSVFHRLLAACPRDSEVWTHKTSWRISSLAAAGGNFDIFFSVRDVCPSDPQFWISLSVRSDPQIGGMVSPFM